MVYLGSRLDEAELKLRNYLLSDKVAVPRDEQYKLIQQLKETAPKRAKEPKRDVPLESTLKLLTRQRDKYKDSRPDIVHPLEKAIKDLTELKEGKESGCQCQ